MTILVAEKDLYIKGSFFCHLSEHGGFITQRHPAGNPTTAAVSSRGIKETHCIKFIFANEHNFKQNYATVNQKVPS